MKEVAIADRLYLNQMGEEGLSLTLKDGGKVSAVFKGEGYSYFTKAGETDFRKLPEESKRLRLLREGKISANLRAEILAKAEKSVPLAAVAKAAKRVRVKAGLLGVAATAAAIGYDAASGEGAQASELKPQEFENNPVDERADVAIGELGDK